MLVVTNSRTLQDLIERHKKEGRSIGFTPTMGALHKGHFSLIKRSIQDCDISICSIFVNPTQFNETTDLEKYPRTLEQDCLGLEEVGCDIVFVPSVEEIYPKEYNTSVNIDLRGLDKVMEGAHRPGHFAGVMQVVKLLVDITDCDRLYMGQKDFQQFTIIRHMLKQLKYDIELVVCPIQRAADGLAMSSRNKRLLPEIRSDANNIYNVLTEVKKRMQNESIPEIKQWARQALLIPGFRPEYFDIVDGYTLRDVEESTESDLIVACTAVWAAEVRLIDNMILKGHL